MRPNTQFPEDKYAVRDFDAHSLLIFKYFLLFSVERVRLRLKQEN